MKPKQSYSQAAEDLLIALLLGRGKNLHYIDIGCLWPIELSNTFAFYSAGGRGLCIDPNPEIQQRFAAERPRDIFVNAGVSNVASEMTYSMFSNPTYNTFDPKRRERALKKGNSKNLKLVREIPIPLKPLDVILNEINWWHQFPKLDFITLDVEGLEMEVLLSIPFDRLQPDLVVCEVFGSLEQILDAPITRHMKSLNYQLAASTTHDCFFRRNV